MPDAGHACLPNFLIVGAAKAGTTSLYEYLGQHPDVFLPANKEPCYFSEGGLRLVRSDDEYARLFRRRTTQTAVGEASTSYLFDPGAPARIRALLGPDVRIFILLRNPADRAWSEWRQNSGHVGYERLSFEEAIEAGETRIADPAFRRDCPLFYGFFTYFEAGLYADQVQRYLDTFGAANVRVYVFEEFIRSPESICRDAFAFLGVDPSFVPAFGTYNAAPAARRMWVQRLLVTPPRPLNALYGRLPAALREGIHGLARAVNRWNQRVAPPMPMDPALRARLIERYEPDIRRLEALLGRDLSIWLAPAARRESAS